uniref:p-glycoprotein n=1 Tax=Ditylenchus dipsaci TaxID=166011 RepID=A0A915E5L6_9BILA
MEGRVGGGIEAIYNNLKGKSVILIAHRLSTVEKADKIVVISKGVVEQIGSHDELLNQDGIYRSLVQRQMIGGGNGAKSPAAASTPSIPRKQTVGSRPQSEAGASGMPGGTQTLSISPRSMAHSLLATSFTQSTSSLQSK